MHSKDRKAERKTDREWSTVQYTQERERRGRDGEMRGSEGDHSTVYS